jgi:NADP-dependent 3-hydroxy acid dehydrogenase YdfG
VHATDAVLPAMRARKEGHIVNVATRYAAVGFSEGIEADLRPTGVRVTTVIAGQVEDGEAREAARRIVDAVQRGDRTITLGWQARLARLAHAVSAPLASTLLSDGTAAPA